MIVVTAEVQPQELPWGGDDGQDEDTPDDDILEPSRKGSQKVAIEDGTCDTETWLQGDGEELIDDGDILGNWMESDILILEEREGRDLLTDGSLLVRWLTGFQDLLREKRRADKAAVASDDDVDGDDASHWRYHGLQHDEVEAAFRSKFSASKDVDSDHHRSFFGFIAERYDAVWDLLPTDSKLQPTILPFDDTSPVEGAMHALRMLEKHSAEVEALSPEQKENVRAWLASYEDTYADGESTVGLLWSLPDWRIVADLYRGEEAASWSGSDPDKGEEDADEAEGWSAALEYSRTEMFAPYFQDSQHHVLETCLTAEASETVKQLVSRGHIYFDGISAEFIKSLNELSLDELQLAITQRADHELALNPDNPSSEWFDCRNDPKASAALALRAGAKGVWASFLKFRA